MLDAASAFQSFGAEVTAVFFSDGPMVEQSCARGLEAAIVPLRSSALGVRRRSSYLAAARAVPDASATARRLSAFLARRRVDVLETNSLKAHVIGVIAARMAGVICVWRLRDIIAPPHVGRTEAIAIRAVARMADAVVAVSAAAGASVRHSHVVVEPSAIRTDRFAGIPALPPSPPSPLHVACISRLARWKGQDIVIDAVRELEPRLDVELTIAGGALFNEGPYAEMLRSYAPDSVRFVGHVADVASVTARAHVIAHTPRMPEPFGKIVIEAMAAGRIAIAVQGAGPSEILAEAFPHWLVESADPQALAAKLEEVVARWDTYRLDAERARLVAARYDVRQSARRLLDEYERLVVVP